MTLMKHEWRQGRVSLCIWTASIGLLLAVCVFLYPEMRGDMDAVGALFASMGSFTAAFGMDRLDFGTLIGFYTVECGNILGLGGAFFASMLGASALAREEKEHTAEFLLTQPVRRAQVVLGKLAAVCAQLLVMDLLLYAAAAGSMAAIGESIPQKQLALLHAANFLLQLELAGLCFGLSAFLRGNGIGVGLGVAAMMYFLNLVANIADSAKFLKYITPFGYTEGADILEAGALDTKLVLFGLAVGAIFAAAGGVYYCRKDIRA